MGGRDRTREETLLPRAGSDVPDRVRQHAERRQPHSLGVARFQRRLWPRSPAGTPEEHAASVNVRGPEGPRGDNSAEILYRGNNRSKFPPKIFVFASAVASISSRAADCC